jgi:hypothetical protein
MMVSTSVQRTDQTEARSRPEVRRGFVAQCKFGRAGLVAKRRGNQYACAFFELRDGPS